MADDFQFIKETRKEKPVNRKRLLHRMLEAVLFGVLFGAVGCLTFVVLRPRLERYFLPEEQQKVSFAENEDSEDEEPEPTQDAEKSEPETVIIEKPAALGLEQYQVLKNKLYKIGRQADKFIVSVTNVQNDTDIFNTPYESMGIGSGIIIADTGENLLILTEKKTIQGASTLCVTFSGGETVKAKLQQYDGNTGLAVLRVSLKQVSQETKDQIEAATLGSSASVALGQMVIAVGSPIGTIYSILTGTITSSRNSISTMDCNYTIFTTDMVGSANAGGVLINTDGEIIGFILQDYNNMQEGQTTLTAVAISELKGVIELLSNDQPVPYLGLRISTVTDEISEDYQMPKGVYVREVALDSPAMAAGFQSGDVITAINDTPISSADDYEKLLRALKPEELVHIAYERQGAESYIPIEIDVRVGVLESYE